MTIYLMDMLFLIDCLFWVDYNILMNTVEKS